MHPFALSAVLIFGFMCFVFVLAQILRDNSIVDVAWGLGFVLCSWTLYACWPSDLLLILTGLISLWGLRLAWYIGRRNYRKGKEDWRYRKWREEWGRWAVIRAFFQVFCLQGFFMWLLLAPVLLSAWKQPGTFELHWVIIGGAISLFGWVWQSVADAQLERFKRQPENEGKIMREGLWAYSRHPNYFGEILIWIGVFVCTVQAFPWWWSGVISPVVITWLLARISGVPMLEGKYKDNPAYQEYVRTTNALIPGKSK